MIISKSEAKTEQIAKELSGKIKAGGLICLHGNLGTGKTVFAKGLASAIGIEKFSIKSPTYTYIREYSRFRHRLYHIDLYRLEAVDELLLNEIAELLENPGNIIIIEWAEKIEEYLPKNKIDVYMEYLDKNSRKITFR